MGVGVALARPTRSSSTREGRVMAAPGTTAVLYTVWDSLSPRDAPPPPPQLTGLFGFGRGESGRVAGACLGGGKAG